MYAIVVPSLWVAVNMVGGRQLFPLKSIKPEVADISLGGAADCLVLSAPAVMDLQPALPVHPYLFFTPLPLLPNRSLT